MSGPPSDVTIGPIARREAGKLIVAASNVPGLGICNAPRLIVPAVTGREFEVSQDQDQM